MSCSIIIILFIEKLFPGADTGHRFGVPTMLMRIKKEKSETQNIKWKYKIVGEEKKSKKGKKKRKGNRRSSDRSILSVSPFFSNLV